MPGSRHSSRSSYSIRQRLQQGVTQTLCTLLQYCLFHADSPPKLLRLEVALGLAMGANPEISVALREQEATEGARIQAGAVIVVDTNP